MTSDVFLGLENGTMEGCVLRKINILKMIPSGISKNCKET